MLVLIYLLSIPTSVVLNLDINSHLRVNNKNEIPFGGKSNGDKQRPSFGEMHAVLAQAVLEARDAKQLGLNSLLSVDAGDEQRASRLIALNGLEAREK